LTRRTKGEGSIYWSRSEQTWIAEITLPDGRRKKKRSKDKKVVQDWRIEQQHKISLNIPLADEKTSVGEYLDRFLSDVVEHTLKPSTIRSYRYLIDKHIKPSLGHTKLAKLSPGQIQRLYSDKLNEGLSPRTVAYIHSVLRRALNQAVKWGVVYRNPTDAVTAPRPTKQVPVTLSEEQVRQFLRATKQHNYYPIYILALHGLRKGEILGLRKDAVNLKAGTLSVTQTLVTIQGRQSFGSPKSAAAKRKITLSKTAIDALKQYQSVGDSELFFTTSVGTPISQRNLTRHFHNTLEKIGLPKIPFHNLRNTCATLLLQKDVHPKVVQDLLGHASITLTLDTYSHVIPSMHSETADKLNDILS
jgi:integrase